jgi:hypothetical protein
VTSSLSKSRRSLGVLKEGAWADMMFVNGDPTKDIDLLADPQKNFLLIIKNGRIYKNIVSKP